MSSYLGLLFLFVGLGVVAWVLLKNNRQSVQAAGSDTRQLPRAMPVAPVAAFAWPALNEYDFEVVGESNYQDVLKTLRGNLDDPAMDGIGTAILVPEDTNPHDNQAVKVTVQGFTIGYLSREDARSFRRRLAAKKLGMVPSSCGLLITGGYMLEDGSQAFFGAQLDMKPFD